MVLRELDFADARAWLRALAIQPEPDPVLRVRATVDRKSGFITTPVGVEGCGRPFTEWNSVPRDYAISRGITQDQVRRWGIGYALFGRLEGRLFLPVLDEHGHLVNYAARSFGNAEKRYLAADTREGPDTSALFGEHHWPEIRERATVLVFEGALNGLAFERALRDYRVIGGMLSERLVELQLAGMSGLRERAPSEGGVDVRVLTKLATFRRIIVATDPDDPGERAADSLIASLHRGRRVERFRYPTGKDACDTNPGVLGEALYGMI